MFVIPRCRYLSKRASSHKQRVLCYILSHVAACPNSAIQSVLLESTRSISSPVKFQTLSPTLAALGQSAIPAADNKITNLLLAVIDDTAAPTLNDNKGEAWATYTMIIQHYFHPGLSFSIEPQQSSEILHRGFVSRSVYSIT